MRYSQIIIVAMILLLLGANDAQAVDAHNPVPIRVTSDVSSVSTDCCLSSELVDTEASVAVMKAKFLTSCDNLLLSLKAVTRAVLDFAISALAFVFLVIGEVLAKLAL